MTDSFARPGSSSLPKTEDDHSAVKLTAADATFWFSVFECVEGTPKIDCDKLATLCGYKNSHTARTTLFNRRKQMRQLCSKQMPSRWKVVTDNIERLPAAKKEPTGGGQVKKARKKSEDGLAGGGVAKKNRV